MRRLRSDHGPHYSLGSKLLAEACDSRAWSLPDLAKELGISRGQASRLVSGGRRPSLLLAARLAALVPMDAWAKEAA